MSDNPSAATTIPQSTLDLLDPEYRAFLESQAPGRYRALHPLKWSSAFRQFTGPPPDLGQAQPVPVGSTRTIALGNFSVRVLTPEGEKPNDGWPVLLFFHGGGFVFGTAETGEAFFSRACADARCVVVSVDYRLAPEHPFPAAVDDAWDALLWLRGAGKDELGIDISRIAVAGASAGGSLTAVLAQRASLAHIPLVLQILLVPGTNATFSASDRSAWPPSMRELENIFSLCALDVLWFRDLYLPNEADRANPDASPLLREGKEVYNGMAPAWVGVADLDVLRSEGELYAEKMKEGGVDVTLKVFKGATHLTVAADRVCSLARAIRDEQIEALKVAFAK
ncbi:hypothetical protein BDV93DRAFT_525888 [Ceratobasidium sp. AG-I]|nr:hypothetical protein BDV93DRAFT_525888 [Ceratobasidium sp. AG-I]